MGSQRRFGAVEHGLRQRCFCGAGVERRHGIDGVLGIGHAIEDQLIQLHDGGDLVRLGLQQIEELDRCGVIGGCVGAGAALAGDGVCRYGVGQGGRDVAGCDLGQHCARDIGAVAVHAGGVDFAGSDLVVEQRRDVVAVAVEVAVYQAADVGKDGST